MYKTLDPRSLVGFLRMPWVLTIDPQQYRSGILGPVVLSLLPLVWWYRRALSPWARLAVFFALLSTAIWYLTYTRLRTLLPVICVLLVFLVTVLDNFRASSSWSYLARLVVYISIGFWLLVGLGNNWRVHGDAIGAVVGVKDRESYADEELRSTGFDWYRDYQHLNQTLPEESNVLIWDERGYYLERRYTWVGGLTRGMATPEQLTHPAQLLALLHSLHVTHTAWHPERHFSTGSGVRQTVLSSGCTFPVYETETIIVRKIEYENNCLSFR